MLRINQLAKELGVSNHEVIEALEKRLGIPGKSHSSNLTDDQGNSVTISRKGSFVEPDGATSVTEDFANNVEYFLFDRNLLQKITPNADTWINRHFGPNFKINKVQ